LIETWRAELSIDAEAISRQLTRLADCGDQIVGFYSLRIAEQVAQLQHLWVLPFWQRRGIGRMLLQDAFRQAIEDGAETLEADVEPLAEPFYLRHGLSRVDSVAAPIPGDANRMRPQMRRVLATAMSGKSGH
jgi:GNAT superfamily N-acetyltransferase